MALQHSDNDQGSYKFLSLLTGRKPLRGSKQFASLPMTNDVINRVHESADNENCGFEFWDQHGDPANATAVDNDGH